MKLVRNSKELLTIVCSWLHRSSSCAVVSGTMPLKLIRSVGGENQRSQHGLDYVAAGDIP